MLALILAFVAGLAAGCSGSDSCYSSCAAKDKKCLRQKVKHCDAVIKKDPANVDALYHRGTANYDLGRAADAEEDFKLSRIYKANPDDPGLR